VFGSDALQVGVAAMFTVGVERKAKRDGPRMEARFAGFAAPGKNFRATEKIIHHGASLGATYFAGLANRAGDGQGVGLQYCRQHRRCGERGQENVAL